VAPGKATVKAVINNGKKKITSKCTVTVRSVKNETDVPVAVPTNAPVTQAPVIVTPTNTPEATVGSTNAPTNEPAATPTNEPADEPTNEPVATPTKEPDEDIKDEPIVTDQFEITYDRDENIEQIIEYTTQDYESGKGVIVDPKVGFARNKETGDFDVSGEGQVNFKVVPKEGYEVDTVTVVAKDGSDEKYYSSIKGKPDTEVDNLFRVTKITGDIIIKITLKVADNTPVTEFVGTFVVEGGHATITTYKSQNLSEDGKTENATSAVARTKEGEVDINGDGQINFVVNVEDGYKAKVKVSPSINYKNIKDSKEDGLPVNTYRITRIYGDITITVKVSPVE